MNSKLVVKVTYGMQKLSPIRYAVSWRVELKFKRRFKIDTMIIYFQVYVKYLNLIKTLRIPSSFDISRSKNECKKFSFHISLLVMFIYTVIYIKLGKYLLIFFIICNNGRKNLKLISFKIFIHILIYCSIFISLFIST